MPSMSASRHRKPAPDYDLGKAFGLRASSPKEGSVSRATARRCRTTGQRRSLSTSPGDRTRSSAGRARDGLAAIQGAGTPSLLASSTQRCTSKLRAAADPCSPSGTRSRCRAVGTAAPTGHDHACSSSSVSAATRSPPPPRRFRRSAHRGHSRNRSCRPRARSRGKHARIRCPTLSAALVPR